jgi:DtxR family Mn-dependent transcriptional regulator
MSHPFLLLLLGLVPAVLLLLVFWPGIGLIQRIRCSRRSLKILAEDALKIVLTEKLEGRRIVEDDLADALKCQEKKFSDLIQFLGNSKWIKIEQGEISLTDEGREYAYFLLRAHRLYEHWLAEKTGYEEKEWHERAERIEHFLTAEDVQNLAAELHFPTRDPHGDPIPTPDGVVGRPNWKPLTELEPGSAALIEHIEDEPQDLYASITEDGFYPGMYLKVIDEDREGLILDVEGERKRLDRMLASQFSVVERDEDEASLGVGGEPLSALKPGEDAVILRFQPQIRGEERRRLMDFGLLPGTKIQVEMRSPGGDPTAYRIRDSLLALRENQTMYIRVKRLGEASGNV